MGMLRVFAGLAFMCGGGVLAGMLYSYNLALLYKFWDDALLIICGGVLLLGLDKLIVTLEEIRNYLKKFSDIMDDK
tara:strand:- start:16 stop:243 length:228 start_codon:yes stop_codon:yes gene_type:complete